MPMRRLIAEISFMFPGPDRPCSKIYEIHVTYIIVQNFSFYNP